jgi:S1-C subfamily serine protease
MSRPTFHLFRRRRNVFLAVWFGFVMAALASCAGNSTGAGQPAATATPGSTPSGSTTSSLTSSSSTPSSSTTSGSGGLTVSGGKDVPVPTIDKYREQAVNTIGPSIVEVKTNTGLGSGVIIRPDGYVVTNHHVVSGASSVTVTLANGRTLPATVRGSDTVDDLAVLKVAATKLPAASFGNSAQLQVGQTVLAIGNPLGVTHTVTDGIVSALNRTVSEGQGGGSIANAIQTSAPINPGNSGGALINLGGQVIGIPTLTAVDPEFNAPASGIGFAIPSNVVIRIAGQIIKYGSVKHTGRAALGILVTSVTPNLAAQYGLPVNHGALIAGITPGGGASKAGMQKNDVIVKVDNTNIGSESDLLDVLAQHSPGDTVQVSVVTQNGGHKTYTVKLGELPASAR